MTDEEIDDMAVVDYDNPKHQLFAFFATLVLVGVIVGILYGVYALFNWIIGLW